VVILAGNFEKPVPGEEKEGTKPHRTGRGKQYRKTHGKIVKKQLQQTGLPLKQSDYRLTPK